MKKVIPLVLVFALLAGCAFPGSHTYTAVTPHDEGYEVAVDSDAMTVSGYLGLKNAILRLVQDAVEEGVIRAESYSGDLAKDLSGAVYEVSRGEPLGAFAVDYMTYDFSQIVSYYEIHIHTTYRRELHEIQSVVRAYGTEGVKQQLEHALENYEPVLRLRVENARNIHVEELTRQVLSEHPEFFLEMPKIQETDYPETGSSRILELEFRYRHSQEVLLRYRETMEQSIQEIAELYGSGNSQVICADRLLKRLVRDASLVPDSSGLSDSAYGALCQGRATASGYLSAYLLLLRERGISCQIVEGTFFGEDRVWCSMELDGKTYFADPAGAVLDGSGIVRLEENE